MALPHATTGSLGPCFHSARDVSLTVKHPYALTLADRFPIGLRIPLGPSVTLYEGTAPVKLPDWHGPPLKAELEP